MENMKTIPALKGFCCVKPSEIERRSFEIISGILGDRSFNRMEEPVIKRVIHTTADFEYADLLKFSAGAVEKAVDGVRGGCGIVTDTKMAAAGINKKILEKFGGRVFCFMDDGDVAAEALRRGITRSAVCMEKALGMGIKGIYAAGNAPTALVRLCELAPEAACPPVLVVGVPVGFVNVVESKRLIMGSGLPYIVSEGRKGGSAVAAAIINAILLLAEEGPGRKG